MAGKSGQPVRNPDVATLRDSQLLKELVPWDHVIRR